MSLPQEEGSTLIQSIMASARRSSESKEGFEYYGTAERAEDYCEPVRSEKNSESWSRNSAQDDKWNFCLTAG
ncbi:hypothetical protein ACFFWD_25410, partial [Bradyrhizobium erythrophlei]|uniref:hypothetical protein n=1 Tax=Bradyrhizobium erythrophlei TaxID=1437360 RepID=UPI0035E759C2